MRTNTLGTLVQQKSIKHHRHTSRPLDIHQDTCRCALKVSIPSLSLGHPGYVRIMRALNTYDHEPSSEDENEAALEEDGHAPLE